MTAQPSATRGYFKGLVAFMWMALPIVAFRYWRVWDQLPRRMVTHFGAGGRPNGWMSREGALTFSLGLMFFVLILFTTILLYALRRMRQPDTSMWAIVGLFYAITAVLSYVCDAVLRYNLQQTPIRVGPVAVAIVLAIFVFVIVFLRAQRGMVLPPANVLSEETHGSRLFGLIFLLPAAAQIAALLIVPIPAVKLALAAGALVLLGCAALAWDGFHYIFSEAGVDVRTLGFRLRSIQVSDIQNYAADRWNVLGGYGIRGIGDRRAYVWGNRGVRIKTLQGEVFLGHSEPEKIVRDLDLMTHNHEAREVSRGGFPS